MIKKLLSSRKFVAMLSGILSSAIAMIVGKFMGDAEAYALSQQLAAIIMLGVSVYAGSQGIADHGDATYGDKEMLAKKNDIERHKALATDIDAVLKRTENSQ